MSARVPSTPTKHAPSKQMRSPILPEKTKLKINSSKREKGKDKIKILPRNTKIQSSSTSAKMPPSAKALASEKRKQSSKPKTTRVNNMKLPTVKNKASKSNYGIFP